ncbi:CBS domain-containing protein [Ramlibacter sp. B156]|uniref:CBS domain-containing protein n=1 Tax=Ramlibacter montanisoli TaxID=2732512 RepID=A0A849K504_9BURK|nr:CBS domain-containing protein [Ramlibacter montanisoli]
MLDSSGRPPPPPSLMAALRPELVRHPPFAHMVPAAVDFFLTRSEQRYYAPGETLVEPASGPVEEIFLVRQGAVTGEKGLAEVGGAFEYEAGDLFPIGAAMARRAVTATYRATADTFVLVLPGAAMKELAAQSPEFADFLHRRIGRFLELSRRALQVAYASQTLAEQSLETPLGELATRAPVTCAPDTPLREALSQMKQRRIGSIIVTEPGGRVQGILTRHDVIGRVALAGVPLDAPVAQVMVRPVHTLTVAHTAQDAALLMSAQSIRHVPVTRDGAVVGIVSERDLFAMQRLSLKQLSATIRAAPDVATMKLVAQDIRRFARNLLSQGVQARQLTALISHLNDVLTQRLVEIKAGEHGNALHHLCWLALGSEGRGEQTIATDQDNALILPDGISDAQRSAARAFGHEVNLALAECGYPLCRGGIMAGEPDCCLTLREWRERFSGWIEHGGPADLLNASIFFDLRPLAGDEQLAQALHAEVLENARRTPRFLKQLALNAIAHAAPLNWLGAIDTDAAGTVDLKLQGTAIFVDAARLYALAHGVAATGTRERLEAAGARLGLGSAEYEAWVGSFEFLQMLRLRVQLEGSSAAGHPNRLEVATLNDIDRRILKESFRFARLLQQRLHLDYER